MLKMEEKKDFKLLFQTTHLEHLSRKTKEEKIIFNTLTV